MIALFNMLEKDEEVSYKIKTNKIYKATFYSLQRYVEKHGTIMNLPWFNLCKEKNKEKICQN